MVGKIHLRRMLKLGNKKKISPLCCDTQIFELRTTIDKKKVTCNRCKLILKEGKK